MELKPGYKQTEVGVIPEDWECIKVSQLIDDNIIEKPIDGNHGNIHPKSGDFVDFGIPFVMANNVKNGKVDIFNCTYIRQCQADNLQKGFSFPGDVLLTHKATIGNTAIVGAIPFPYLMLTPQVTYYRIIDKKKLKNTYLFHYFGSKPFQEIMCILAGGGTRSYIGITSQHQLPIVIPDNIEEQSAIATVLSDADGLIGSLEQLIAKKRHLKQAAMQQLLTGKKRLPGFETKSGYKKTEMGEIPVDWIVKDIASMCDRITTGKLDANAMVANGPYRFYTCAKQYTYIDKYAFDAEALLVSGNGANVGYVHYYCGKFNAYQRTYVLYDFSDSIKYIQHYLREKLSERIRVEVNAGNTPYITRGTIAQMLIASPSSTAEQTAIAEILSDMDSELSVLETKLAKARQLKQGLMRELLTGRIRLV